MPELPEVEVLARHLAAALRHQPVVRAVAVQRARVIRPTPESSLRAALTGARFAAVQRRGKFLIFTFQRKSGRPEVRVLAHLGMTGRMYLQPARRALPKHAAVALDLGRSRFVFEDTRYFGRFTLELGALELLGPEPLSSAFNPESLRAGLARSAQPVKVKLLDQRLVVGVGNIYASEALFRAGISPRRKARCLRREEVARLHASIRDVLSAAIAGGSTIPLDFAGTGRRDGLFYYGQAGHAPDFYEEHLLVYDRAGQPCVRCGGIIRRIVQAARSTFFCPRCQR